MTELAMGHNANGGIRDEDALNRPFPFTLVVNNHNERDSYVIARLVVTLEACGHCHGSK